jgi:hypothetical protein
MRPEDMMLQAQRDYIQVLKRFIRAICTALEMGGTVDTRMMREAIDDDGAVPEGSHDGNTEPPEQDDPRELEAIRAADHIPTQELRAVTDEDLEAVS